MNRSDLHPPTGTPTLRAALASPPDGEDPVAEAGVRRTQVATAVRPSHQRTDAGRPGTSGGPSAVADAADIASQAEDRRRTVPAKSGASVVSSSA